MNPWAWSTRSASRTSSEHVWALGELLHGPLGGHRRSPSSPIATRAGGAVSSSPASISDRGCGPLRYCGQLHSRQDFHRPALHRLRGRLPHLLPVLQQPRRHRRHGSGYEGAHPGDRTRPRLQSP
ncbi:MAG: hypothetical protein ACLRWQ_21695 [Flavonifractor plautii]